MSHLDHDNDLIIVDAVLTIKGKEVLSDSHKNLNITKFAVADDEVDYRLWNYNSSDGTDSYGRVIENMPCLEASHNHLMSMRYPLLHLPWVSQIEDEEEQEGENEGEGEENVGGGME